MIELAAAFVVDTGTAVGAGVAARELELPSPQPDTMSAIARIGSKRSVFTPAIPPGTPVSLPRTAGGYARTGRHLTLSGTAGMSRIGRTAREDW
ncbi:hypothetical protein GCM10022140_55300 [Rhodococcus aetherivorans]